MASYVDPAPKDTSPSSQQQQQEQDGANAAAAAAVPLATALQDTTIPTAVPCLIPPRRFTPEGKVTSVDLTPDGRYVFAGCSDGTLRMYSMVDPSWGHEGLLLGQIHAKGLITNLLFHVEVADDGRFAFAGVLRGAVEMFAYDLTKLPTGAWAQEKRAGDAADEGEGEGDGRLSKAKAEMLIECHTNFDPKLRGFGAVARLAKTKDGSQDAGEPPEYRLICGLGIKNLHIWRFQEGPRPGDAPAWECLFDLVSNGMSIELLAIRAGGMEAVSKSCGQNLRVWDLSSAEEKEKAPYTDVVNTQDTCAVFGGYAFGGTCQLSLVRLDACRQLNRMELPLPTTASTQGKAKRRQLCSVKDVVGTHGGGQDGRVLIICSDGGVHCYESTGAASATGRLVPVHSLTVEEGDDVTFHLASVGKGQQAAPVVLQTRYLTGENVGEIWVAPLQLGQLKEEAVAIRRKALGHLDTNVVSKAHHLQHPAPEKPLKSSSSSKNLAASSSGGTNAPGGGKHSASAQSPSVDEAPQTQPPPAKKPATKKRAKSLPAQGSGSLAAMDGSKGMDVAAPPTAAAKAASKEAESAAAVPPPGLVLCKPLPVRRPTPLTLPEAAPVPAPPPELVSYYPIKRKHYDPFAAMNKPKRGKNHFEGPPKAMRDLEAKRLAEDGSSKTVEFFKARVARQDILRDMRVQTELQGNKDRLAATTSFSPTTAMDQAHEETDDVGPISTAGGGVRTWTGLRQKHAQDMEALMSKFRGEHNWLRDRFLNAVERERLMFHVHRQALPSSVKDPLGFLWWHNSRLPVKKQWGRYRAFPQASLEVMALTGQPDVAGRRFSLTAVIANYKDLASRMVRRQQAEADALAAVQSMDLPFAHVQLCMVVYPYAEDFTAQDPVGQKRKDQEDAAALAASASSMDVSSSTDKATEVVV